MYRFYILVLLLCASTSDAQYNNRGTISLFDNGPIITGIGTGLGGADESILENVTLGMITFGAGHQLSAGLRVADDFVISSDEWQIDSIDFFAYQTSEPAPSITSINLRIWDGVPGDVNSNVVFGDTTTNIIGNTSNSGVLRVDENSTGVNADRQITVINVQIGATLPQGTYWLDWQTDGTGGSGPFVPHVTIPGQTTTGNALQSTNSGVSYGTLLDLGTFTGQGLPFTIYGNVQGIPTVAVPMINQWSLFLLITTVIMLGCIYQRKTH